MFRHLSANGMFIGADVGDGVESSYYEDGSRVYWLNWGRAVSAGNSVVLSDTSYMLEPVDASYTSATHMCETPAAGNLAWSTGGL